MIEILIGFATVCAGIVGLYILGLATYFLVLEVFTRPRGSREWFWTADEAAIGIILLMLIIALGVVFHTIGSLVIG